MKRRQQWRQQRPKRSIKVNNRPTFKQQRQRREQLRQSFLAALEHCQSFQSVPVQSESRFIQGLRSLIVPTVGAIAGAALLLVTAGYLTAQVESPPTPPEPTEQVEPTATDQPKKFKVQILLSAVEDLKVREGDTVKAGQILADRTRDRQRLQAQKQQLQIQLKRLQIPAQTGVGMKPVPPVAHLPEANFLNQVASIQKAELQVAGAEQAVNLQQRKLDLLQTFPQNELPEATLTHEQKVLEQKRQELDQVAADLRLAQSQLAQAQSDRQYQEYLHSLEEAKQAIALNQQELQQRQQAQERERQERDRSFQLAQVQVQLQHLENQIANLGAVRSPYGGQIKKVKWLEQTDSGIRVDLTLDVDGASDRGRSEPAQAKGG